MKPERSPAEAEEVTDLGRFQLRTHRLRDTNQYDARSTSLCGAGERDQHANHGIIERPEHLNR
jgi:hypothetical protein